MPLNASEASIEAEIKTKGLTAPRLTPENIDAAISSEDYYVFPNTTVTVCALHLRNGFVVIGHSASASAANFDPAIGKRVARERARNEIWALEGYLLRERLAALEEVSMMQEAMTPEKASALDQLNKAVYEAIGP
jgi:hypothetical protein